MADRGEGVAVVTEAALLRAVRELCRYLHVEAYHTFRSDRSEPGFPDLVICGPRGVIFRELKSELGRLTKTQQQWGDRLAAAGADWAVWRPRDLHTIAAEIERLCGRGHAA